MCSILIFRVDAISDSGSVSGTFYTAYALLRYLTMATVESRTLVYVIFGRVIANRELDFLLNRVPSSVVSDSWMESEVVRFEMPSTVRIDWMVGYILESAIKPESTAALCLRLASTY